MTTATTNATTTAIANANAKVANANAKVTRVTDALAKELENPMKDLHDAVSDLIDDTTAKELKTAYNFYLHTDDENAVKVSTDYIKTANGNRKIVEKTSNSFRDIVISIAESWGITNLENDKATDKFVDTMKKLRNKDGKNGAYVDAANRDKVRESFIRVFLQSYVYGHYNFSRDEKTGKLTINDNETINTKRTCNHVIVNTIYKNKFDELSIFSEKVLEIEKIRSNHKEEIAKTKKELKDAQNARDTLVKNIKSVE